MGSFSLIQDSRLLKQKRSGANPGHSGREMGGASAHRWNQRYFCIVRNWTQMQVKFARCADCGEIWGSKWDGRTNYGGSTQDVNRIAATLGRIGKMGDVLFDIDLDSSRLTLWNSDH